LSKQETEIKSRKENRTAISIRFWILYVVADIICVGMGMGVPIFAILLGFPIGCMIARRVAVSNNEVLGSLTRIMYYAALTAAVTMLCMALLWGSCIALLFDPTFDFSNFGIPMILYAPKASFVGWLILMIFISPFLQFLMTLFSSNLTLMLRKAHKQSD
jgi:hypothetical protein